MLVLVLLLGGAAAAAWVDDYDQAILVIRLALRGGDADARAIKRAIGMARYRLGALKLLVDTPAVMEKLINRSQAAGIGCAECAKTNICTH